MSDKPVLRIRTPQDVIAAVPYLLGFHPADSIVVVAYGGPRSTCALRLDLPPVGGDPQPDRLAAILKKNNFEEAVILGYGPQGRVAAAAGQIRAALLAADIDVTEAMHVGKDRWHSLTCTAPCCPPEGRPYDITTSELAAEAILAGHQALPDREDLVRSVARLDHPMREATAQAEHRWFDWAREGLAPARIRSRAAHEGITLLDTLLSRFHQKNALPTDDEIAWLGILLTEPQVRDEAWTRVDPDDPDPFIDFWRHMVQRVEESYATAPAVLLAYAAYSAGNGALANIALDRASPDYTLGWLLRELMAAGVSPQRLHAPLQAAHKEAYREAS